MENSLVQNRIPKKRGDEKKKQKDRIRGCLIGGAVGDALGYPVEFMREGEIFYRYGNNGITDYELRGQNKKALISDDTQMTLFTAYGLAKWQKERSSEKVPSYYVQDSYQYWLMTQEYGFGMAPVSLQSGNGSDLPWLCSYPELYERRAPGNTCLHALGKRIEKNRLYEDYIEKKINESKGCGGVMRVAPAGCVRAFTDIRDCDMEGAMDAAITHGHPLGYLTGALLAHIVHRSVFRDSVLSLREIVLEAVDTVSDLFPNELYMKDLQCIVQKAVDLADKTKAVKDRPIDQIHDLGEGWVAEEAVAIAIFCTLCYQNDFDMAMIASVNHNGDSDSTGAIAGNILGAWIGYDSISENWKKNLELHDAILRMADELMVC